MKKCEYVHINMIKVGVGKGYDGHVVKGISKTTIFEKNDALQS